MQTSEIKCLSHDKINYDVPASIEEFDKLAGRTGAALDEANKNVLYRAVANQARYGFLHGLDEDKEAGQPAIDGLEKLTGIERKTKVTKPEQKDAEGKITQEEVVAWDESEATYEKRVYAELVAAGTFPSIEAALVNYRPLMQQVWSAIKFDPSKQERQSAGPKKTPKTYVGIAEELLLKCSGSVEDAVARFNAKNTTGQIVTNITKEGLAKGIWDDQVAQKKKIAEGYAS